MALIQTEVIDKTNQTLAITGEALVRNKKIKRIKATSAE
jgi:hypothetical protein